MPENIEIKAKIDSRESIETRARALSEGPCRVWFQEDTYFFVPEGRLKLRREGGPGGQLIHYRRADTLAPKPSRYCIAVVKDAESMIQIMESLFGIRGQVTKERTLYMAEGTRIHLDRVQGLGDFMEIEVLLEKGRTQEEGKAKARSLMERLGVSEKSCLRGCYLDLLEALDRTGDRGGGSTGERP